ncbi:MAG TPA: DUF6335 family protein [Anaerolineales bacterium]
MAKDEPYHEPEEETIDSYTGEKVPAVEDADKMEEIVPVDPGDRDGADYLLEEEDSMDSMAAEAGADDAARLSASYSDDPDVKDAFLERQALARSGRQTLEEELDEHNSKSPKLSAGDLDADWQSADQSGEETVGGSTPTPDQNIVDEMGRAVGVMFSDTEPLRDKFEERDRQRWELNPASAEDEDESAEDTGEEQP